MPSIRGNPPRSFAAVDPKERLAESTVLRLNKAVGDSAGIVLRMWKRGVIEIRDTRRGMPAFEQDIGSHKGWLIVGINGQPVYDVQQVGEMLRESGTVNINVAMPREGDIPKGQRPVDDSLTRPVYNNNTASHAGASHVVPTRSSVSPNSTPSYLASKFRPGERVEVFYGAEDGVMTAGGRWYPAEVVGILSDGTYSVTFETGEAAEGVAAHSMRHAGHPSPSSSAVASPRTEMRPGDRVDVFYGPDEDGWYPATVTSRARDGTYTVRFEGAGEIAEGVSRDYLRTADEPEPYPGAGSQTYGSGSYGRSVSETPLPPHLGVGSTAEVFWEGTTWTPCVIKAYHPQTNMYDVDWMDRTETNGVMAIHVRPAQSPVARSASASWR
eukprot:Rhum_TRINITY_DN13204_c0_g1::Rhum_TRINITY_DN13204_c0_g1_i1::g.58053::m.58053